MKQQEEEMKMQYQKEQEIYKAKWDKKRARTPVIIIH